MYLDITREVRRRIAAIDALAKDASHWLTDEEIATVIGPTHVVGVEHDQVSAWLREAVIDADRYVFLFYPGFTDAVPCLQRASGPFQYSMVSPRNIMCL